jgi:hypothetical protein
VTPAEIPAVWGPVISFIGGFEPEEDADLMAFVRGNAAAKLAVADAWHNVAGHCVSALGLDPAAVQGMADYADGEGESAHEAAQIWHRFAAVYHEVQEWIASGGTLPRDGTFLTGEGA